MSDNQRRLPAPGFVMPSNALIDAMIKADLSGACFRVMLCLMRHVNQRVEDSCFPSIPTLCKETGLKERMVYRALKQLEKENLLRRSSGGRGPDGNRSTHYFINDPSYHARHFEAPAPECSTPSLYCSAS